MLVLVRPISRLLEAMTDATLEQLKDLIVRMQPDGHGSVKLPTERELARTLDVQRSTLRERLAALEALGLIRRTQGSGTYLALPDSSFLQFYFEIALKLGHFNMQQLSMARALLERGVAREAALQATEVDIVGLEDAYIRMLAAGDAAAGDAADHEFHLRLARATHNPAIALLIDGLSALLFRLLQQRRQVVRAIPGAVERSNAAHAALLAALRAHDPAAAETAIEQHFRVWEQVIVS